MANKDHAQFRSDFVDFLSASPSAFHASKEIANRLAEADFIPLSEEEKWKLEPGKGYFIVRDDAAVMAWRTPKKKPTSALVLASHIDSPTLKLKPSPELAHHQMGLLSTEVYGGPLLYTWFDRELYITGRLTILDASDTIQSVLVSLEEYPVIIPSLAVHLNREVNDKGLIVNKQDHLKPIFTLNFKEKQLESYLRKHHNFKKLLSFDLVLAPLQKPTFLGFDGEMLAGYRLDNLTSVYASLYAMTHTEARSNVLQMSCFWDHEEIGSRTLGGADSSFAQELFERIGGCLGLDREDLFRLKSKSLCLSSDLAHALHPNYADKHDPQHACLMGGGVVLKFNAGQSYATSGSNAAALIHLAQKRKWPLQQFAYRADLRPGSTVGSMMAAQLGLPTIDLGIAGLAMHSTREVIAIQDELSLMHLLQAALEELA
jgi:aspartyl aminopeptidase